MENFLDPAQSDILKRGIDRCGDDQAGVLIPRRRKPIRRDGHGQRPADHEAEETSTGRSHRGWRAHFIKFCDHRLCGRLSFRKRLVELAQRRDGLPGRCDMASVKGLQVNARSARRVIQ